MNGMWDARCPKCKRRYGGRIGQSTDCPHCKRANPAAADDLTEVERVARLIKLHPSQASPEQLKAMRELSGLSQGQAAERLALTLHHLDCLERGKCPLASDTAKRMSHLYGCGWKGGD